MSTLEVNTINPQSGTTITIGGSGDTVSLGSGATQSGFGGVMTPYFEAYSNAHQTVSQDTWTKVTLGTEEWDSAGNFASNRFTPTTAGKYHIFGSVCGFGGTISELDEISSAIYKNGSVYKMNNKSYYNSTAYLINADVSAIIDFNGSTDYVELYGKIGSNNSGRRFQTGDRRTFLAGYRIIE